MQEPNDHQGTILRWEDHIVPILEHPDIHIRDKALVAVAWEAHARRSELHQLSFGDVDDRGDHVTILVTGPDGRDRKLTLCGSTPYLKRWIQAEHPVSEQLATDADPLEDAPPETPVWTEPHSNKEISTLQLRAVTKRVSKCADVSTEFTLHDIRRSRAILLTVQSGLRPATVRDRFGWTLHEYEKFAGLDENDSLDEDIKPSAPIQCPNCGAWAPRHQSCLWCGASRS